jgi:hypothetical protein
MRSDGSIVIPAWAVGWLFILFVFCTGYLVGSIL